MKSKKDYTMELMSQRYQYDGQRDWGRLRYSTIRMISFPIVDDLIQNSIFSNIYIILEQCLGAQTLHSVNMEMK